MIILGILGVFGATVGLGLFVSGIYMARSNDYYFFEGDWRFFTAGGVSFIVSGITGILYAELINIFLHIEANTNRTAQALEVLTQKRGQNDPS